MTLKELLELRAKAAHKIRDLNAALQKRSGDEAKFNSEEQAEWTRCNADYDRLTDQISVAERAQTIEREQRDAAGDRRIGRDDTETKGRERRATAAADEQTRELAIGAWFRSQCERPLSARQRRAARAAQINPQARFLNLRCGTTAEFRAARSQFRAQGVGSAGAGGATVAATFMASLELAMLTFGPMLQVADVIRTETGADLPWPSANDTGNEGEILGENTPTAEQDLTFASTVWKAFKFGSKLVKVSAELLEDSAFDLASTIGSALGERIGRRANRAFTVGVGTTEPRGIVTASAAGVTAASATAIAAADVIKLSLSLDTAYTPGAAFMMHTNVLQALRLLNDSNGRPLWNASLQEGTPERLCGYPLYRNDHMASAIATGARTILFGQLTKYKIRQVRLVRTKRLVERFGDSDQEGFVAFQRMDGNLLDAGTGPVKRLTQA